MAEMRLEGKTAAILIADGYFEHEYWFPYYRFKEEGAKVITAGLKPGVVYGEGNLSGTNGLRAKIDTALTDLDINEISILFLPGGTYGPLFLRADEGVQKFVREYFATGRLLCAICHAPWILVSAGVLKGRRVSCPNDISPDIIGAGAEYIPGAVVSDGNLLSAAGQAWLPEMFRTIFEKYFP
jgi:protease I